ncbi:hypothetical protein BSIN_3376 [Burkholderia singularis]|uniref:Uncharacterized protein n=1 Tax=Burkholderia singularis TaxID=1503053 RepID=A0A238H5D6_9BURK|nr:hypothetical protein BSIN_3376 [Burkholderia singularis]
MQATGLDAISVTAHRWARTMAQAQAQAMAMAMAMAMVPACSMRARKPAVARVRPVLEAAIAATR